MTKIKVDLSKYSEENLQRINKFIKLIKNQVELEGISRLSQAVTIPLEKSEFSYEESLTMTIALNRISGDETVRVINEEYHHCLEEYLEENDEDICSLEIEEIERKRKEAQNKWLNFNSGFYGISKDNLKSVLALWYSGATGLDLLWQIEQVIKEELGKNNKIKNTEKKSSNRIKEIIIIEPRSPDKESYKFVINEDYKNAKKISRAACWKKIIDIIKDEKEVEFDEGLENYFNYNKRCAIYCKGKYKLTQIFEKNRDFKTNEETFKINSAIKTKIISEKAYKTRLKKT